MSSRGVSERRAPGGRGEIHTRPDVLGRHEADAGLDPHGPRRQTVDKEQREVGDGVAAVPLDLARPSAAAHGARGRGRRRGRPERGHGHGRVEKPGMWCGRAASEASLRIQDAATSAGEGVGHRRVREGSAAGDGHGATGEFHARGTRRRQEGRGTSNRHGNTRNGCDATAYRVATRNSQFATHKMAQKRRRQPAAASRP
jgi:hypothetical protein